jgi:hypothetical protein
VGDAKNFLSVLDTDSTDSLSLFFTVASSVVVVVVVVVCVCVDEGGKRGETGAVLDFDRELLPPSTRQPWIRTVWVTASHGQM